VRLLVLFTRNIWSGLRDSVLFTHWWRIFQFAEKAAGQRLVSHLQRETIVYFQGEMTLVEYHADIHPFIFAYCVRWHDQWDKILNSCLWSNDCVFMNLWCTFWDSQFLKLFHAFTIFLSFRQTSCYIWGILLIWWNSYILYLILPFIVRDYFCHYPQWSVGFKYCKVTCYPVSLFPEIDSCFIQ
jgi:hypothetical protein